MLDLKLPGGRLRAERRGPADAPIVLCVHGLSANLRGFDFLSERLERPDRQIVALDLRGRGRSEITPPGSYGLDAHVRDILDAATELGAERFDFVGWSMGALLGIGVAAAAPDRLGRLALIDHAGDMDPPALDAVRQGLLRLDAVVPTPEAYIEAIRAAGAVQPWSEEWDRFYRYELGPQEDGFSPTTSRAACQEDLDDFDPTPSKRWPAITMPALLVRCTVPINGGFIVPEHVLADLRRAVPHLRVVEVDRNHHGVMTHERTAAAIDELLGVSVVGL